MVQSILKLGAGIVVAVIMFTGLSAFGPTNVGVFGSQKASAADPHGNWSTQRDITRSVVSNRCHQQAGLWAIDYISSGTHGSSSRSFQWRCVYHYIYGDGRQLNVGYDYHVRISSTNVVWAVYGPYRAF